MGWRARNGGGSAQVVAEGGFWVLAVREICQPWCPPLIWQMATKPSHMALLLLNRFPCLPPFPINRRTPRSPRSTGMRWEGRNRRDSLQSGWYIKIIKVMVVLKLLGIQPWKMFTVDATREGTARQTPTWSNQQKLMARSGMRFSHISPILTLNTPARRIPTRKSS